MNPYLRKNQELWDAWTEINYRSAFYDVAGFKAERSPLDAEVLAGLGDLAGKSPPERPQIPLMFSIRATTP